MKRILLAAVVGILVSLFAAQAAWAFGWKDVRQMHRDGIPDSLIVQKIEHSGKTFHLEAKQMKALREAGVSDTVISAMLKTEDEAKPYDGYSDYGYGSRYYLGFDYGYYHPYSWYYGSYYGPYYPTYGYYPRTYGRYYGYGDHYRSYRPRYQSYQRYGGHAYRDYGTTRTRTNVGPSTKGRRR